MFFIPGPQMIDRTKIWPMAGFEFDPNVVNTV